jgi:tetratricopeptide (TPR) repeat protein
MSERTEDTIELLKTQLLVQPNNPVKRYMLGKAYAKLGRLDEAIDNFNRAVAVNATYGDALYHLGVAYSGKDKWAEAASAFDRAVKSDPKEILDAWYRLGQSSSRINDHAKAVAAYDKVLQQEPAHLAALNEGGDACVALGDHPKAEELFTRATAVAPDDATLHHRLGLARHKNGRLEEAIAAFRESRRLDPNRFANYVALARVLAALYRRDQAVEAFKEGLRLESAHADVLVELGEQEEKLDRLEDALGSYTKALELLPRDEPTRRKVGWVLLRLGRNEEALDLF